MFTSIIFFIFMFSLINQHLLFLNINYIVEIGLMYVVYVWSVVAISKF